MPSLPIFAIIICTIIKTVVSECEFDHGQVNATYKLGTYFYNGTISECHCSDTSICVRKCCHLTHNLNFKTCAYNSSLQFEVDVFDDTELVTDHLDFRYIPGNVLCDNSSLFYRLEPFDFPEDQFYLQRDGRLWQPAIKKHIALGTYCLEYFEDIGLSALVCFNTLETARRNVSTVGMMISMPFLLLTFIVYALLPERNLHAKSLMCFVITLFGSYCLLVVMQQHTYVDGAGCVALGSLCLYFFIVSFLWMNAMSVDIWWTFRGIRGFSGNKREIENKRFLMYSIYTWGVALLFVVVVTIINEVSPKNAWFKPGIGDGQCWFTLGKPELLYFYGPLGIIVIVNIILYARTAWKIKQIQQDTAILRRNENKTSSEENDKQRFYLYLKLFIAMGVNWSMEVISWAVGWQVEDVHSTVWILTDLCNALYGVIIFFIFVFKRPIWNLLKKRYYLAIGKIQMARTIGTSDTPSTSTTVISLCQRSTLK